MSFIEPKYSNTFTTGSPDSANMILVELGKPQNWRQIPKKMWKLKPERMFLESMVGANISA